MNPNLLEKTTSFVAEDQRITLYGVSWQQYEILRATLDDFAGLKMTYLEGTLELFMPGAGILPKFGLTPCCHLPRSCYCSVIHQAGVVFMTC